MAEKNITQLRRLVFRKYNGSSWDVFVMGPDDLGQDTTMALNIAERKRTRASSMGTTEAPIRGTIDNFTASVTFLADTFSTIGKALNRWNDATFEGHKATDGNMIGGGDDANLCAGNQYVSVVAQGICDDESETDVEIARCMPSVDDDIELGTSETPTITLNLNPIIYNPTVHSADGYEQYSYRLGTHDLTAKQRLDAADGTYKPIA